VSARGGAKRPISSPTRGGGKCPVPAALSAAEEDVDSSSDESGSDASGPDSGDSAPLMAPLCGDASSDESDPGDSVPASAPALVPLSGDDLGARSPVSRPARPRVRLGFLVMSPVPVGALPALLLLWFPFWHSSGHSPRRVSVCRSPHRGLPPGAFARVPYGAASQ
jgi:hypothetical protein